MLEQKISRWLKGGEWRSIIISYQNSNGDIKVTLKVHPFSRDMGPIGEALELSHCSSSVEKAFDLCIKNYPQALRLYVSHKLIECETLIKSHEISLDSLKKYERSIKKQIFIHKI